MVPSGFKSGGHFIFKKVTSAGLNSLQQKEYQISVKNWIFDDPFPKKGPISVFFWWTEVVEVTEAAETLRPGKFITEDSRVIYVLFSMFFGG